MALFSASVIHSFFFLIHSSSQTKSTEAFMGGQFGERFFQYQQVTDHYRQMVINQQIN